MRRYTLLALLAIPTTLVCNGAYSYVQVLVGRAFDLITTAGWTNKALLAVALTVAASAAISALSALSREFSVSLLAHRIKRDARDELYVSLLGKSQSFHGRQRIGDLMARATDDVQMLTMMFIPGLTLIVDSLMALVIPMILIARLDLQLLLVPVIFCLLLAITVFDYNRRLSPVTTARREQYGMMNAGLAEAVAGIEVVKANAQEKQQATRFVDDARLFRNHFVHQGEIQARYWPSLVFIVSRVLGFLHAMLLWRNGTITMGQGVAFVGLMGLFDFPTHISIFTFDLVQLGIASARRILEMINTETELDENEMGIARPIEGTVIFNNVSFQYNGQPVLKDISFRANPGETIAIVGRTGSGKTTLTRLINRIFDADEGHVLIDGVDVRDWSLESLRSQVSTIEQDVFLFSRSLAENIAFGRADAGQETIEFAAREAQAHNFISSFADGYETTVGERGVTLSGGQRQRIAIARAFLTDPRILILDDSTSAIDSATEDNIQRAMLRISQQRTTFIITHRLSQIRWADRILVLDRGELVDQGTHEELLNRCPDYQRIFARPGSPKQPSTIALDA
ncbi:MAG: ABC transporter ATP-binding protein [Anaerolineae bacterium]|nr:ABC transporter ATP-binding protein [Anaerolineae bacterium]